MIAPRGGKGMGKDSKIDYSGLTVSHRVGLMLSLFHAGMAAEANLVSGTCLDRDRKAFAKLFTYAMDFRFRMAFFVETESRKLHEYGLILLWSVTEQKPEAARACGALMLRQYGRLAYLRGIVERMAGLLNCDIADLLPGLDGTDRERGWAGVLEGSPIAHDALVMLEKTIGQIQQIDDQSYASRVSAVLGMEEGQWQMHNTISA